jgi:hypothetical protein
MSQEHHQQAPENQQQLPAVQPEIIDLLPQNFPIELLLPDRLDPFYQFLNQIPRTPQQRRAIYEAYYDTLEFCAICFEYAPGNSGGIALCDNPSCERTLRAIPDPDPEPEPESDSDTDYSLPVPLRIRPATACDEQKSSE